MREADDELISKGTWFADAVEGAIKEAGDLVIPLAEGKLKLEDIKGDLFSLTKADLFARKSEEEITCFKSVGHALEDLVAAELLFNQIKED